LHHPRLV